MSGKPEVRLEQWVRLGDLLHGQVYGHPRFTDGERVITSRIIHDMGAVVETKNTLYLLGLPWDVLKRVEDKVNVEEES